MKARQPIKELAAAGTADEAREPVFQDWARFVSFQPRLYFRPQDLDELKRFLAGLQQGLFKPGPLRVLGGLHSCSDICVSDAILDVSDLPSGYYFVRISVNGREFVRKFFRK